MAKLMQSNWLIALVAIGVVVVTVRAVLVPHNPLNWIGVALWVILLITMVMRRRHQPPPGRMPPGSRGPGGGRRRRR